MDGKSEGTLDPVRDGVGAGDINGNIVGSPESKSPINDGEKVTNFFVGGGGNNYN